ncbi:MAG: hypothetical protein MSB10_06540 [Clostridiales bacterium]|uniref:hypothetical protein n=1 Tax=Flavonifractor porci TaxID=3133422 RepID=UPI0030B2415F|nr:hypothetical protein [Clostridiales bacterium]
MSATELQFRTATFGGFQKQDVLSYIESSNQAHVEKLAQLQREWEDLAAEKESLAAQAGQAKEQAETLAKEKESLTARLDEARKEAEALRAQLDQARREAEETAARLADANARLTQAEPDAAAYQQVKDRTAGIELEAHCRAQEIQREAEEKVRRAHTEVEQWLHKVQAGYDLLRSDMDGAISRTGQELDKLRQMLEQLSSNFSSQDEHLRKLAQDCADQFAPPAPLPLDEK